MSRTEGRQANLAPHPGVGSWSRVFDSPGIEKFKSVLRGWEIEEQKTRAKICLKPGLQVSLETIFLCGFRRMLTKEKQKHKLRSWTKLSISLITESSQSHYPWLWKIPDALIRPDPGPAAREAEGMQLQHPNPEKS